MMKIREIEKELEAVNERLEKDTAKLRESRVAVTPLQIWQRDISMLKWAVRNDTKPKIAEAKKRLAMHYTVLASKKRFGAEAKRKADELRLSADRLEFAASRRFSDLASHQRKIDSLIWWHETTSDKLTVIKQQISDEERRIKEFQDTLRSQEREIARLEGELTTFNSEARQQVANQSTSEGDDWEASNSGANDGAPAESPDAALDRAREEAGQLVPSESN